MTSYGVLGTGVVGRTLASKLVDIGHQVRMGTRDVEASRANADPGYGGGPSLAEWIPTNPAIALVPFAEAIDESDVVINALHGSASVDVLAQGGLDGKLVIDVANPLDFSTGQLDLWVGITDSLGETIQRTYPAARVVKTLNTVTAAVMVDPGSIGDGDHTMFVAGEDASAKSEVTDLLRSFGWRDVRDLGGIQAARGMEAQLVMWLTIVNATGSPMFNVKVVS